MIKVYRKKNSRHEDVSWSHVVVYMLPPGRRVESCLSNSNVGSARTWRMVKTTVARIESVYQKLERSEQYRALVNVLGT